MSASYPQHYRCQRFSKLKFAATSVEGPPFSPFDRYSVTESAASFIANCLKLRASFVEGDDAENFCKFESPAPICGHEIAARDPFV